MEEKERQEDVPVVRDYRKMTELRAKRRRQKRGAEAVLAFCEENRQYLTLFAVIVLALAVILGSAIGFHIPAAAVCVMVVLEAALAVCLHDVPIWLHGLVVVAQIIAGALCGKAVFMLLCALMYVAAILSLRFLRE